MAQPTELHRLVHLETINSAYWRPAITLWRRSCQGWPFFLQAEALPISPAINSRLTLSPLRIRPVLLKDLVRLRRKLIPRLRLRRKPVPRLRHRPVPAPLQVRRPRQNRRPVPKSPGLKRRRPKKSPRRRPALLSQVSPRKRRRFPDQRTVDDVVEDGVPRADLRAPGEPPREVAR